MIEKVKVSDVLNFSSVHKANKAVVDTIRLRFIDTSQIEKVPSPCCETAE